MKSLEELPNFLDNLISSQKQKPIRTFVAKYKDKNITVSSGKSSWKAVNHAKAAIIQHFSRHEDEYAYNANGEDKWNTFGRYKEIDSRRLEFRAKLWELIEIVELT